jgi:diguanylate cyclase (GGDEF)-like protein/PAS domain S-box-containing protein
MKKNFNEHNVDYRTFVDKSPHLFFDTDLNGNFLFANKTTKKLIGFSPSQLLKTNLQKIVAPEYHDSLKSLIQDVLKRKNPPPLEVEFISRDGNRVPFEIQLVRTKGKEEGAVGLQVIARDISERKKAREDISHLHQQAENLKSMVLSLLDNAPNIAIQGFNQKGEVVFWNKFSEKLFGFSKKMAVGKTLKDLILSEPDDKAFRKQIKSAGRAKRISRLKVWRTKTKSGETKSVLYCIFPPVLSMEEPTVISVIMDITGEIRAKEKIKEIYRQLERFSGISADLLSIEDEKELFNNIAQAVIDISDFRRVLISYFIDTPPYREIIGHKGIKEGDLKRVKEVKMPREKYLEYFEKGIKIGNHSCYIPHTAKGVFDNKAVIPGETKYPEKEGHWHKEDTLLVSMKDTKGQMIGIMSVDESKSSLIPTEETVRPLEVFANLMSEVIQKHKLAKIIGESEQKYRELVTNIKIGIFRATPEGRILEANPALVEMFGYANSLEFLNLTSEDLFPSPDEMERFIKELEDKGFVKNADVLLIKKDGTPFWASITSTVVSGKSGRILYYDTVIEDITERKKLEEEVERLTITDELTGLLNRRHYNRKMPEEIKTAEKWKSALSLIMVDIDDFKQYNELYLHLEGDKILRETAQSINNTLRKEADWAARFGGDEFVIILPGTNTPEAAIVAERIRKIARELKFKPKGKPVRITVSTGVATFVYSERKPAAAAKYRTAATNYEKIANELTKLADKALLKAKQAGKNRVFISKKAIEWSRLSK